MEMYLQRILFLTSNFKMYFAWHDTNMIWIKSTFENAIFLRWSRKIIWEQNNHLIVMKRNKVCDSDLGTEWSISSLQETEANGDLCSYLKHQIVKTDHRRSFFLFQASDLLGIREWSDVSLDTFADVCWDPEIDQTLTDNGRDKLLET